MRVTTMEQPRTIPNRHQGQPRSKAEHTRGPGCPFIASQVLDAGRIGKIDQGEQHVHPSLILTPLLHHHILQVDRINYIILILMDHSASEAELRTKPLKELYPDVELRAKYRESKMSAAKSSKSVFIRLEPHKSCKIKGRMCFNIISPISYDMGHLPAALRDRMVKEKTIVFGEGHSLFLYLRNKVMTAWSQKVGAFWEANKD